MQRIACSTCLIAVLLCAAAAAGQEPADSPHFTLEQLADGVWMAVQNDRGGFAISNAGIVDLGDQTLIFDTFLTPAAARDLRDAAEALTGRPAALVALSHFHNDHIRGSQVFDGARILATPETRAAIAAREPQQIARERERAPAALQEVRAAHAVAGPDEEAELRMWVGYYEGMLASHEELETVLPQAAVDGTLTLHGTRRTAMLVHTGQGHTDGDLVLFLPEERIAFLGDLLFVDRHPFVGHGHPDDWVRVLQRVYDWGTETVVPGHGPAAAADALLIMTTYIEEVGKLAASALEDGLSLEEAGALPVPAAYAHWWYASFFPANVRFMYQQVAGAP
jgi:cyclase